MKYINPGYISLLHIPVRWLGTREIESSSSFNFIESSDTAYSNLGVSLYPKVSGDNSQFSIDKQFSVSNNEIWIKFDAYIASKLESQISFNIIDFIDDTVVVVNNPAILFDNSGICSINNYSILGYISKTEYFSDDNEEKIESVEADAEILESRTGIKLDEVNSFLIHCGKWGYAGDSEGENVEQYIEITINGTKQLRCKNTTNFSNTPNLENNLNNVTKRFFNAVVTDMHLSNIIVSDEEILPNETIIELPIGDTETDMLVDASGTYVAMSDGEMFLQSVDTDTLISKCGAAIKLTNIIMVGDPAYKVGEELNSATSITKLGDTITEHTTYALTTDSSTRIVDSWDANISIAALKKMQFGWKVNG